MFNIFKSLFRLNQLKEHPEEEQLNEIPKRIYILFVLIGIYLLLGWNVIISSMVYYEIRLAGIKYLENITPIISIIFTFAALLFVIIAYITPLISTETNELTFTGILNGILMFSMGFFAYQKQINGYLLLWITGIQVFLITTLTAFSNRSVWNILSSMSPDLIQATSFGNAAAGAILCILKFILIKIFGKISPSIEIFFYYSIAGTFAIATIIFYISNRKTIKNLTKPHQKKTNVYSLKDYIKCIKLLKEYPWTICINFWITLLCFPLFLLATRSTSILNELSLIKKSEVFNNLLISYNISDLIGRRLLTYPTFQVKCGKKLLIFGILRGIHILIYLMGNLIWVSPVKFRKILASDLILYLTTISLGLTNGLVATNALVEHGKMLEKNEEYKKIGFGCMIIMLNTGLFMGSVSSYFLSKFLIW